MDNLSKSAKDELVGTYASLLLYDCRQGITGARLRAIVDQTGNDVSDATVDSFASNLAKQSISTLVSNHRNPRPVDVWDTKADEFDQEDVEMGGLFGGDDDDY